MSVETIRVPLGTRSYDVRVGEGLIARAEAEIAPLLARPRVAVLTDENVAAAHLDALKAGLAGIEVTALSLPAGEPPKAGPRWKNRWNGCCLSGSSGKTS